MVWLAGFVPLTRATILGSDPAESGSALFFKSFRRDGEVQVALQKGSLGTFPAVEALPLAMAQAGRLTKYGA